MPTCAGCCCRAADSKMSICVPRCFCVPNVKVALLPAKKVASVFCKPLSFKRPVYKCLHLTGEAAEDGFVCGQEMLTCSCTEN